MAKQKTTNPQELVPMFSAIILHYHNGKYLYETIDSVLRQDYPNIELIICDDATGEAFSPEKVQNYINLHKGDNIKRVIVHANEENFGTVRNMEIARSLSLGEFELSIAGDDVWHDSHVFSAFAEKFSELGEDAECIVSQVEMYDHTLKIVHEEFVKPEIVDLISEQKWDELYDIEISTCVLPAAGTAYRRSLLERHGKLSGSYRLVEDYSLHLRLLSEKTKIFWLDIKSVKHRTGGVSHSENDEVSLTALYYMRDLANSFLLEVYPNAERFSAEAFERSYRMFVWNSGVFAEYYRRFFHNLKTEEERQKYRALVGTLAYESFLESYEQRIGRAKEDRKSKEEIKAEVKRFHKISKVFDCQPGIAAMQKNTGAGIRRFFRRAWFYAYRIGKKTKLIDHVKNTSDWPSILRNVSRIVVFTSLYALLWQAGQTLSGLKTAILVFGCLEVVLILLKVVYSIIEKTMDYKR